MKTQAFPLVGTGIVFLLALIVFAWRQQSAIERLKGDYATAMATANREREAHVRVIEQHEKRHRDAQSTIAQLQRELTVARAAAGLDSGPTAADIDPAYAELRRRNQRRIIQERYGDLFVRLNLPGEQLEQLKRLLLELDRPTRPDSGGASGSASHAGLQPRTQAEVHHDIYTLLGYDGYQAFDRYTRELLSVRPLVRQFAHDAADSGHPLSAEQREELARTMFDVLDTQTNPLAVQPGADVPNPSTGLSPLDDLILSRAGEVLSGEQLVLLRQFRIDERQALAIWRKSLAPAADAPTTTAALPTETP
jgi:hypothetical protein